MKQTVCVLIPRGSNYTDLTTEWFTLMNRDKYAGEVYLELTFWSNVWFPL